MRQWYIDEMRCRVVRVWLVTLTSPKNLGKWKLHLMPNGVLMIRGVNRYLHFMSCSQKNNNQDVSLISAALSPLWTITSPNCVTQSTSEMTEQNVARSCSKRDSLPTPGGMPGQKLLLMW